MATQRYVSTSFWDDAWIQGLDPSEKLLYLYLMTNPLTNIAGIYKITIRRISFDTGFNGETVSRILDKFEQAGKAYLHGEYIILPSWPRHQQWEKRSKIREGIESVLKKLPKDVLETVVGANYAFPIPSDILSVPYTYLRDYSDSDSDSDRDRDINNTTPTAAPQAQSSQSSKVEDGETELYHAVKDAFLKEQPGHTFKNWGKEGKAINQLIKDARSRAPDSPERFVMGMIAAYDDLRQREEFFGKHPFTPSALNSSGIYDRVLNYAKSEFERRQRWEDATA